MGHGIKWRYFPGSETGIFMLEQKLCNDFGTGKTVRKTDIGWRAARER
jgi:hypothetical protein